MFMKTRPKNMLLILLMSISLVFVANSFVFAGAGEPGAGGGGDEKYAGPAVIVELNMQSCEGNNPNEVVVTGSIKCKGVPRLVMLDCQYIELCGECDTFDEITQDDLMGFTLFNEPDEETGIRPVCDVDASPAVVRVVTKFENSGGVINVTGVCLFEKSQF